MNRPNAITVATIAAVILAGSASMMVHSFLKKHASGAGRGVSIVAAAVDIPMGTKLESAQVRMVTWPKEDLPPGSCTNTRTVMGRMALRPIAAGDAVTEQKLLPLNGVDTGIMTYIVPPGHRAVTVSVNEVAGVAGFITPSSRVDVVLTTPRPGAADREDNISKIILQNVPVLACGQVTEQKEGKPTVVPTVTLDLVPEEAEKLIVGAKKGSLQLLLRNVVDVASVPTQGATIAKALGGADRPAPSPVRTVTIRKVTAKKVAPPVHVKVVAPPQVKVVAPTETFTLEILNGATRTRKTFNQD